jgi:hypothetical protein
MAATKSIDTPELSRDIVSLPIAANTTIFAGTLVAVDSNGRAVPAADTAGLRVIGRAEEEKTCGATAGAESLLVKRGIFRFANSATDAVDANDLGKDAFVEDDATVSETGTTHKVKAGRIVQVDSAGVWIDTDHASRVPSSDTLTALTFSATVTSAEADALRDAVLALLQAQGLVK